MVVTYYHHTILVVDRKNIAKGQVLTAMMKERGSLSHLRQHRQGNDILLVYYDQMFAHQSTGNASARRRGIPDRQVVE
jgi:hypothetical protein